MDKTRYGRDILEGLDQTTRFARLKELQDLLNWRFSIITEHKEFFEEIDPTIAALKSIGHELFSWDYNGEATKIYGGDYMHLDVAGKLVIEFTFPKNIVVRWEE